MFATSTGTMMQTSNTFRWLKKAARDAGVGFAGWHTLRHTCASVDFRHGASAKQVQLKLGHHSPAFTLATYVHLLPDDLADAAYLDDVLPVPGIEAVPSEAAATVAAVADLAERGGNTAANRQADAGRNGNLREATQ